MLVKLLVCLSGLIDVGLYDILPAWNRKPLLSCHEQVLVTPDIRLELRQLDLEHRYFTRSYPSNNYPSGTSLQISKARNTE